MSVADADAYDELSREEATLRLRLKAIEAEKLLRGSGYWHRVKPRTKDGEPGVGISGNDADWFPIRSDYESALLALAKHIERESPGRRE